LQSGVAVAIYTHIREVRASNFDRVCSERGFSFLHSLQTDVGMVPWTRSWPSRSKSLRIRYTWSSQHLIHRCVTVRTSDSHQPSQHSSYCRTAVLQRLYTPKLWRAVSCRSLLQLNPVLETW